MSERKRIHDLCELIGAAAEAIAQALDDGSEKHPVGNWRGEDQLDLSNHAAMHMMKLHVGDNSEAHLEHAICDLVMMYALRRNGSSQA